MKIVILAFCVALIALSTSETFDRSCRSLEDYGGAMIDFKPEQYLGKWLEVERYEQVFQVGRECCFAEYKFNDDGSVNVINNSKDLTKNVWSHANGIAVVSYPNEEPLRAMLNVTFPATRTPDRSNYWVLSTDYTSYSIIVSCRDIGPSKSVEAYWLLAREYPVSEEGRETADKIIEKLLDRSKIRTTIQDAEKCN